MKRARIVVTHSGPIQRVQLRHIPSDWLIYSTPTQLNVEATAARIRTYSARKGYMVDEVVAIEEGPAGDAVMRSVYHVGAT